MRYLVTYWSQTGNTRKVAEAIFEVLPAEKSLKPFDEVETLDGYDFIFTGFPILQFGPPPAAKIFLSTHAAGKNIAMFVTHAIPGANPQQQVMLGKELGRCRSAFAKSEILGRNYFLFYGADADPRIVNEIKHTIRKGMSFHGEMLNFKKISGKIH